ncbi:MAG: DUF1638 domain-containing protein [Verrucomicrobia bacterium]|nr:DUF1638 domain-containing protein [Verrucomicrobiota bacterium]
MFLKVIACEIAFREICFLAAQSPHLLDLEFLTQGLHDTPCAGRVQIQSRIDAVPPGKYGAVLIGYGLCGNIIAGLRASQTPLVIPRAHDCITFFLGSRERYGQLQASRPSAYYYTSGWLECLRRRGEKAAADNAMFLPTRAGLSGQAGSVFETWVQKYGEEQARYLVEVMDGWTESYTHGVLIDFDFTKTLRLREQVQEICSQRGWQFDEINGDLRLLRRWLNGEWDEKDFLVVQPQQKVVPSYDPAIVGTESAETSTAVCGQFNR